MKAIDYIQLRADELSENKYFIGAAMVLVNIGARFIIEELSDEHREFIKSERVRKVIIFCSVFMATRDIFVAIIVTAIFSVLIHEILKEKEKPKEKEDDKKGGSFVKQELDKQIDQLKVIKDSL
jgi:putative Mn2+ efflux pump MntP